MQAISHESLSMFKTLAPDTRSYQCDVSKWKKLVFLVYKLKDWRAVSQ